MTNITRHLPDVLKSFGEIKTGVQIQNTELETLWAQHEGALANLFILTANEWGIAQLEKLLGILPSKEDTLESRRARVQARWYNPVPYTMNTFLLKLISLCGTENFSIIKHFENEYRLELETNLEYFGQVEELERIVNEMLPCNMVMQAHNKIPCKAVSLPRVIGGVCHVDFYRITNDSREHMTAQATAGIAGTNAHTTTVIITD